MAIIGPVLQPGRLLRQVTEKNKTPFMLPAVADNLTEGGLRYVFRVQPNGR